MQVGARLGPAAELQTRPWRLPCIRWVGRGWRGFCGAPMAQPYYSLHARLGRRRVAVAHAAHEREHDVLN
eukprot:scaffold1157_cov106-Isochrysis_galbana.AAC.3